MAADQIQYETKSDRDLLLNVLHTVNSHSNKLEELFKLVNGHADKVSVVDGLAYDLDTLNTESKICRVDRIKEIREVDKRVDKVEISRLRFWSTVTGIGIGSSLGGIGVGEAVRLALAKVLGG